MSFENSKVLVSALLVATAVVRMQEEAVSGVRHNVLRDVYHYRTRWRRRSINAIAVVTIGIGGALVVHSIVDERRQARTADVEELTPTD